MLAHSESVFHDSPKLLAHNISRVLDLQVTPFSNDLLCSERSFNVSPSRIAPPLPYSYDLVLVRLFLLF